MSLDEQCKHKVDSLRVESMIEHHPESRRANLFYKAYNGNGCYDCSGESEDGEECLFYKPPRWQIL